MMKYDASGTVSAWKLCYFWGDGKWMTKPWKEDSGVLNSGLCFQTQKSPCGQGHAVWCVALGTVTDGTPLLTASI